MSGLFEKTRGINLALSLSAASGLIYEVVAVNMLFFYFAKSSYSVATALSVFLFGLGLGSFLVYKFKNKIQNKKTFFVVLQVIIALYSFFVLANLTKIIPHINTLGIFLTSFLILLLPTLSLGAVFPLASNIISENKRDVSGMVYSVDLIGAVLGTLIAGFWLIPLFGNRFTVLFAVVLNLLSALIIARKHWKIILALCATAVLATMIQSHYSIERISSGSFGEKPNLENLEEVTFKKASAYGEIEINSGILYIDGRDQCSLFAPEKPTEKQIVNDAIDPFGSRDLDVLNIGLGCGLTLSKILEKVDPEVDIVEINPVVVEANSLISDVLWDEKVNLIMDDGLHFLRKSKKDYDVIIIDIENPAVIHASDFYTEEASELISQSLNAEGVFGLWVCRCNNNEYYDIIYNTLKKEFPHVYKKGENIFIASKKELDYEPYVPSSDTVKINTIDLKILSKVYIDNCKWWKNEEFILNET